MRNDLVAIIDVLFDETEQEAMVKEITGIVRERIKSGLVPAAPVVEEPKKKKCKKNSMSPENRARAAERMRQMVAARKAAKGEPSIELSGSSRAVLHHVSNGSHWPSEVGIKINFTTARTQSIMKDLEKQGLLCCPRDDTKAYFEITQAGQKVLEENSVKESGE